MECTFTSANLAKFALIIKNFTSYFNSTKNGVHSCSAVFVGDPNIETYPIRRSNYKSLKCLKRQTQMHCLRGRNISNVWLAAQLNQGYIKKEKLQIRKNVHEHVCLLGGGGLWALPE